MGKPRVGIVAAWITGGCVVLAALIGVFRVNGSYIRQEMNSSPGATQVAGDQIIGQDMERDLIREVYILEADPDRVQFLIEDGKPVFKLLLKNKAIPNSIEVDSKVSGAPFINVFGQDKIIRHDDAVILLLDGATTVEQIQNWAKQTKAEVYVKYLKQNQSSMDTPIK